MTKINTIQEVKRRNVVQIIQNPHQLLAKKKTLQIIKHGKQSPVEILVHQHQRAPRVPMRVVMSRASMNLQKTS